MSPGRSTNKAALLRKLHDRLAPSDAPDYPIRAYHWGLLVGELMKQDGTLGGVNPDGEPDMEALPEWVVVEKRRGTRGQVFMTGGSYEDLTEMVQEPSNFSRWEPLRLVNLQTGERYGVNFNLTTFPYDGPLVVEEDGSE